MDDLKKPDHSSAPNELENYRRRVDLQSQIVEQARRNGETERLCRRCRQQTVPTHPAQPTHRTPGILRIQAQRILRFWRSLNVELLVERLRRQRHAPRRSSRILKMTSDDLSSTNLKATS